jgi:hypothetical protein
MTYRRFQVDRGAQWPALRQVPIEGAAILMRRSALEGRLECAAAFLPKLLQRSLAAVT